jgi:hypothetical protein
VVLAVGGFWASVLLDAGESVRALAEYLGHADPGFTLRVATHLMPAFEERTRRAVDQALRGVGLVDGSTACSRRIPVRAVPEVRGGALLDVVEVCRRAQEPSDDDAHHAGPARTALDRPGQHPTVLDILCTGCARRRPEMLNGIEVYGL